MRTDKTILADNYIIEGGVGELRPNDNVVAVGCSGVGKSMSVEYPTLLATENSSVIASFAKSSEARLMAGEYKRKGYEVLMCDLDKPEKSNVFFDPLQYISTDDEIVNLSNQIVSSVLKKSNDDYWNGKAKPLLSALISMARMLGYSNFSDVLQLFDNLNIEETTHRIETGLDDIYHALKQSDSDCFAVREFNSFRMLPLRTACCVRDTLAVALSAVFPEAIRNAMKACSAIDFKQLATKKTALFIVTSPVKASLYNFANLIFDTAIKQLLEFAQECEGGKLPRPVRLFFDDFACSAPIAEFPRQISIFRSAGISAMILLQSESQLQAIYGSENSTTILNNCSTYVYFPSGMDLTTCRSISERMDRPLNEILSAPMGQVFIMQSGKKPVVKKRYDIFNDPAYIEMISNGRVGGNDRC